MARSLSLFPPEPPEPEADGPERTLGRRRRDSGFDPGSGNRKIAGSFALAFLVLLAAAAGSLAGLTLVYSVDLPQIDELEHYRPSTLTDLYDRNGRIIGSFSLGRRWVRGYRGFAPILREAVLSIEDKSFESHWGVNVLRIGGA